MGDMRKSFEAVYENGVLRPLEALDLANGEHVHVDIRGISDWPWEDDASAYFEPAEWEASKTDDITLDEVWAATSSMKGSLSDAVIAAREEQF